MKHQTRIFSTTVLAVTLAACVHHGPVSPPILATLAPSEKTMDCPQIDLAIDRADTVRWMIRDEGGKLETNWDRGSRYVANVIVVPLGLLGGMGLFIGDGGHALLSAADSRLRELLQLKRARGCAPRATALPGMDEFALLRELESIQAHIDAGSGDEAGLFSARTKLLDDLRIVPGTAAVAPPVTGPAALEDKKTANTQ